MRGMNGELILKEKTEEHVIYYYSSDTSCFGCDGEVIVDGEIEYIFVADDFITLKTAMFDDDGGQAKWLYPHVWNTIFRKNCPEKRFIATG